MLIFISDLHLLDHGPVQRFEPRRLLAAVKDAITAADPKAPPRVVLLGDTIDLLHSPTWLACPVRPWAGPSEHLATNVEKIVNGCIITNDELFRGFRDIQKNLGATFEPIVGNHDALINRNECRTARQVFRVALGQEPSSRILPHHFSDMEHMVHAEHGHSVDRENWCTEERASTGDVAVIEMLEPLASLVAGKIGLEIEHEALGFLRDLQYLRPLEAGVVLRWIRQGINHLNDLKIDHTRAFKEVGEGLVQSLSKAKSTASDRIENSAGLDKWIKAARFMSEFDSGWWPNMKEKLARNSKNSLSGSSESYKAAAESAVGIRNNRERIIRYYLMGHTHDPHLLPLGKRKHINQASEFYFNTGTWGIVHEYASIGGRGPAGYTFGTWHQEVMISIYTPDEARRLGRGFEMQWRRGQAPVR